MFQATISPLPSTPTSPATRIQSQDPPPPPPLLDPREPLPLSPTQQVFLSSSPNNVGGNGTSKRRAIRTASNRGTPIEGRSRAASPIPGQVLGRMNHEDADRAFGGGSGSQTLVRAREDSDDPLGLFERDVEPDPVPSIAGSLILVQGTGTKTGAGDPIISAPPPARTASRSMSPTAILNAATVGKGDIETIPSRRDRVRSGNGFSPSSSFASPAVTGPPDRGVANSSIRDGLSSNGGGLSSPPHASRATSPGLSGGVRMDRTFGHSDGSAIFERDIEIPFGAGGGLGDVAEVLSGSGTGYRTPGRSGSAILGRGQRGSLSPPTGHDPNTSDPASPDAPRHLYQPVLPHDTSDARVPTVLDEAIEALLIEGYVEVESPVPRGGVGRGRELGNVRGWRSTGSSPPPPPLRSDSGLGGIASEVRRMVGGDDVAHDYSDPDVAERPRVLHRVSTGPVLPGGFPSVEGPNDLDDEDDSDEPGGNAHDGLPRNTGTSASRTWRKKMEDWIGPRPTALISLSSKAKRRRAEVGGDAATDVVGLSDGRVIDLDESDGEAGEGGQGLSAPAALLSPSATSTCSSPPILSPNDLLQTHLHPHGIQPVFPSDSRSTPISSTWNKTDDQTSTRDPGSNLTDPRDLSASYSSADMDTNRHNVEERKRRISFVSYNDMLHAVPVRVNPLGDLIARGDAELGGRMGSGSGSSLDVGWQSDLGKSSSASSPTAVLMSRSFSAGGLFGGGGVSGDVPWDRTGLGKGLDSRLDEMDAV